VVRISSRTHNSTSVPAGQRHSNVLARARDRRRAVVGSGAEWPSSRASLHQRLVCSTPAPCTQAARALSVEGARTTESGLDKTRSALAASRAMSGPWLGGIALTVMAQQGKAQREARPAEWESSPLVICSTLAKRMGRILSCLAHGNVRATVGYGFCEAGERPDVHFRGRVPLDSVRCVLGVVEDDSVVTMRRVGNNITWCC